MAKTEAGKKALKKGKDKSSHKRGNNDNDKSSNNNSGNWKKKFKKAFKTPEGLAHIMSVMKEEEHDNSALIASLQYNPTPALPPTPAEVPPANPLIG